MDDIRVYRYKPDDDLFVFEPALLDGEFVRFFSAHQAGWRKFIRARVRSQVEQLPADNIPAEVLEQYRAYVAIAGIPATAQRRPTRQPMARSRRGGKRDAKPARVAKVPSPGPVSAADLQVVIEHLSRSSYPLFVTGRAGTGKSTILKHIAASKRGRCVVLAFTGIAALTAGGMTFHRFFGFPLRPLMATDVRPGDWTEVVKKAEVIIIDEVSMVRCDLLDCVSAALQYAVGSTSAPFGGKSVVLFGDPYQLPAFVAREHQEAFASAGYGKPQFFNANAFQAAPLRTVELQTVYRQSDRVFIDALDAVRRGQAAAVHLKVLNDRVQRRNLAELDDALVLTSRRDRAQEINDAHLQALTGEAHRFVAATEGTLVSGQNEAAAPAPPLLVLKRGARVMLIKNDMDGRWVNGSLGEVEDVHAKHITVALDGKGSVKVERETWQQIEYDVGDNEEIVERVVGSYTQFPLQLAWATTIHKSQGLTLDRVHVDLGDGAFAPGQTYVALSRCRSLQGLSLERPLRSADLRVDPLVRAFMEGQRGSVEPVRGIG